MKKRSFYLAWITILIVAIIAGCGSNSSPGKDTAKESIGSESAEKPVLRIIGGFAPNIDPKKDIMIGEIEKTTGYKVDYTMLPQDSPDEKLNLEIASGAKYDILALSGSQFYKLAAQGALLPLDGLLEQDGANIKKAIKPESWELTRLNGKIYGIPQKNERPNIEQTIAYRKDILDELGLKVPETIDEFTNMLKTVKEAYPQMIPLTGFAAGDGLYLRTLLSGFGIFTDWTDVNGTLVERFTRPEMKDYLGLIRNWYVDHLIDQDWGVNKVASAQEKFTSGKAFAMPFSWADGPSVTPALEKNVPGAKLAVMNPLKDANGNAGIQANQHIIYIHAILKTSKNAQDAMKFMDLKLERSNFTYLTLGEEGKTFKLENGVYSPIMPIFTEQRGSAYWFLNGIDEYRYPDMWLARTRRDPNLFSAFELLNKDYAKYSRENPASFAPPFEAVSKYQQSIGKMQDDYGIKVMMGSADLADHDSFMKEWGSAGGSEIVKTLNDWYQSKK